MLSLSSPLHKPSFAPPPAASRSRFRISASAAAVIAQPSTTMYDLLSVSQTARPDEIKAAYRRQALRWHPDACRSAGDERSYAERFMQTREAYEVLSDPLRRRNYDLSLSGERWAAAVGAASAFRSEGDKPRAGPGAGFGDWEAQLEMLRRRSAGSAAGGEETWGGRMRRARRAAPSV
ncbi:chaperone protein dnaJ 20, chloroplastic-like [Canna indica]|uniref:Chaperone protein dnaJ 20, chloroplastic-like n=1 Tax=Canna indica TaxID=4628 RepID=A0AAQ3KUJ6_9LILI|nr:chaperone protein dnaJ 20, chloroplastic-like [Canna indica]